MKARDVVKKGEVKADSLLSKLVLSPWTFAGLVVVAVVVLFLVVVL